MQTPAQRHEQLKNEINFHSDLYHRHDAPIITDEEYDKLFAELQEIERNWPSLQGADSPTLRVGGEPLKRFKKVEHLVIGKGAGKKAEKAKESGIQIVSEDDFLLLLKNPLF